MNDVFKKDVSFSFFFFPFFLSFFVLRGQTKWQMRGQRLLQKEGIRQSCEGIRKACKNGGGYWGRISKHLQQIRVYEPIHLNYIPHKSRPGHETRCPGKCPGTFRDFSENFQCTDKVL